MFETGQSIGRGLVGGLGAALILFGLGLVISLFKKGVKLASKTTNTPKT